MQVKFFKNSKPNALDDVVAAFIREDPRRVLRDVRISYGAAVDAGMIDDAIAVAVLYDIAPGGVPLPAERLETDPGGERIAEMDRRRDEAVRDGATRVQA